MVDLTTRDPEGSAAFVALDDDAWMRELVTAHAVVLRKVAVAQVGPDAADDAVSEAFAAAWRDRRSFDPAAGSVRAWLVGILLNRCRAMGRAQQRWRRRAARVAADAVPIDLTDDVVARADAARRGRSVVEALYALPPQQRTVLVLVARAGLNATEIAEVMSIPAATVRSHLARARTALAEQFETEDGDDG